MKRFSAYPPKTEHTSSFRFRKTVNSLFIIMYLWFFKEASQRKHTSHHCIHFVLTVGTCLHVLNTFLAKWPRNIKQFGNDIHISETMSGTITGGTQISDSSEMIYPQTFYDCERTERNFGMPFFACCYQEHYRNEVYPQFHWNTLFSKKKCKLPSSCRNSVLRFHWCEMYADILRPWENHDQFWNVVFGKLLPLALPKWCITPYSLRYTLLQKKGNFKNVAILLTLSVDTVQIHVCTCNIIIHAEAEIVTMSLEDCLTLGFWE